MSRRRITAETSVTQSVAPLDASPQDQCLRNPDLLEQILRYCGTPDSVDDDPLRPIFRIRARRCIYGVLLTCRGFFDCGVKILWASLDNFLPLLRLLPSFALLVDRDSRQVYHLPGSLGDADWAAFDRYAAYVKEIIYARPINAVDPLVYVRLATRGVTLLPNLSRLQYLVYEPSSADILLAISPSITWIDLACYPSTSRVETFLSMLSAKSFRLSHLYIWGYDGAALSSLKAFDALQSLELQTLEGPLSASELVEIGTMPLQSFTTDMVGWDDLNFETIPPRSIFVGLVNLNVEAAGALLDRNIPLLLPRLGGSGMHSISIRRRNAGLDNVNTCTVISEQISSRWAMSLKHLELREIPYTLDAFSSMQALTQLETLTLQNVISTPLSETRVLAVVRALPALTALSIEGAEADLTFFTCVAQSCRALRELHVGCRQYKFPDSLSTTPALAHPLHTLRFFETKAVAPDLLARHLDRLFPRLARITGESSDPWDEVQKLVFMCQDVRRTALQHQ
ncbi:hypothetical protein B0H11DRAFT_2189155 [Mycena galericulata]|nr:hypothetical protein B0H11DRAFT_2189155 [Mycena galericulata]